MRTVLDLSEDLLNEVVKATKIHTKIKIIVSVFENLIKKSKNSEVKKIKVEVGLDVDLGSARGCQCRFWQIRLPG